MKKTILILLATCFLQANTIHAQNNAVDSLKKLLLIEKEDSNRVKSLNRLAYLYLYNNTDTALAISQQALMLSKKIGYDKGEAESLRQIGNALTISTNYAKGLELHLASLKIAEKINDDKLRETVLSNIGVDYGNQGDYHHLVQYTRQALALARQLNDKPDEAKFLANLGEGFSQWNILDSARMYTNLGYDMAVQLKNTDLVGMTLNNLGNIYSKMGQDDVAMANYRLSLPYYLHEDDEDGLCETYLGMAKLFRKAGKTDSSLYYAKLSLAYGKKVGFTNRVMNASAFLTDYYTSIHNVDSAFAYQSATIAAKDSLFSQEKQKEIQNLTFNETMRQQELALAKVAEEKQRSNNIQFAIIAIAIVSFIIISLLLSRTVIVNERWISFLGVLGLLLFFEFVNLYIHPYIAEATHESPLYSLLIMVLVASLLIPLHHRIEHWIKEKMVARNRKIRLAAAKRTVAELEKEDKKATGS